MADHALTSDQHFAAKARRAANFNLKAKVRRLEEIEALNGYDEPLDFAGQQTNSK